MKFISTFGIAVLLCIVAALWFAEPEDETNATPGAAVSSGFDAGQQMGGNGETPQQRGLRQRVIPSEASTARRDVGSDSAISAPTGSVALAAPETEQVTVRNATEGIPGQSADTKPSPPSAIDKTDCEAAAKTLETSLSIFDVTPTLAVWYARSAPSPHAGPTGFDSLKAGLLAPLCSGTYAFSREDYAATMEFVAISTDSHVRILVGDTWISDGTVLSPLSEQDQAFFANPSIQMRRRQGIGPGRNMPREVFERRLAQNPRMLIAGP
jgi:hypothetical protein